MDQSDIRWAKDWRLRARLKTIKKALIGCTKHPNGMSAMLAEILSHEEKLIRAEIKKRRPVTDPNFTTQEELNDTQGF